ncbi:hypothetical protein BWI96_18895 [Siphonobacter sp. SORGH_AS_0500]|uniref:hypothetical protein n=1 Tax=Siphonobacter sp. SORGH_AS_0500 TaxID=1864824 RepID=UPI000CB19557|nr:hypothetical protein [Siphonobacter sp. SORGH_AS_0500]PKK35122.1 hypothetical protein BWI96_18895 [Siphonobacter sp. SORGH_AS_0500]
MYTFPLLLARFSNKQTLVTPEAENQITYNKICVAQRVVHAHLLDHPEDTKIGNEIADQLSNEFDALITRSRAPKA